MSTTKTTWIRRAAAGAVLAAAPALIALGTATASQAQSDPSGSTSPSFSPRPPATQSVPWNQSSWIHQHQAYVQSQY